MLDALAGWDGKIPQTLLLLVRRPGALTAEFLAGRRARYLRPLRLYLTMSVAFFLSLTLVRRDRDAGLGDSRRSVGGVTVTRGDGVIRTDSSVDAFLERHRNERGRDPITWAKRGLTGGMARVKALPGAEQRRAIFGALLAKAPNMVFVLLPVFALLLRVLYRRSGVYYAEHLVFALHTHAFAYLALTVVALTSAVARGPLSRVVFWLMLLWIPAYGFLAMHGVYGGSRRRTLAKFVALSASYGVIFAVAMVATMLLAIIALA